MQRAIFPFERLVALRHITSRRRQTFLAVGAVALAVAITIVSRASVNGYEEVLLRIVFEVAPHVAVAPKEGEQYIYLYRTLIDNIWTIPGVVAVSPTLTTSATLTYEDDVENVAFSGVIPSEMNKMAKIGDQYMVEGELAAIQNGRRIAISQKMADELDVKLGDSVEAAFPDANELNLVVVGIFNTGVSWDDYAFVSLETAREFLGEGDVVTEIFIQLDDIYRADAVAAQIETLGYTTYSWQRLFPEILRTLKLESVSNNIIMLLILTISTFGIANVMNMLVLDKTKEIGMIMSIGGTPSQIRRLFIVESGLMGLMGGIFGCALGYLFSIYLNSLNLSFDLPTGGSISIPFIVDPWDLLIFTLFAVILSTLAGAYPAHRASRLDPIEALRA